MTLGFVAPAPASPNTEPGAGAATGLRFPPGPAGSCLLSPPHPPCSCLLKPRQSLGGRPLCTYDQHSLAQSLGGRPLSTYDQHSLAQNIFSHPKVRFPSGSAGKESACDAGDACSTHESRRSPGEGYGNRLPYSCLGNPMDRGAWRATAHGVQKGWTRLSTRTHSGMEPISKSVCLWTYFLLYLILPSPEQQVLGASGVGHRARHFLQSPVSPRPCVEFKAQDFWPREAALASSAPAPPRSLQSTRLLSQGQGLANWQQPEAAWGLPEEAGRAWAQASRMRSSLAPSPAGNSIR